MSIVTLKVPSSILHKYPDISNTPPSAKSKAASTPRGKAAVAAATSTSTATTTAASSPAPPTGTEDGTPSAAGAATAVKNPKANAGPVNEKLRALDRSGAKTRHWAREPVLLKNFTGYQYSVVAWGGELKPGEEVTREDVAKRQGIEQLPKKRVRNRPAAASSASKNKEKKDDDAKETKDGEGNSKDEASKDDENMSAEPATTDATPAAAGDD